MSDKPKTIDPLVDALPSRYVVGIDLGTTNSAAAYVDTEQTPWKVRTFPIPQLVAAAQVEVRETLPSFHYQLTAAEAGGVGQLPWGGEDVAYAVGFLARDEGTKSPGRLIGSAKSWLCHSGVDRTAELLPWQGAVDVERLSPVEVTARYLRHIRDAWNATFRTAPLSEQQLVIMLPASFDEVARELTVKAAAVADLPRVSLIEEPQAAFYAWVNRHPHDWQDRVEPGQKILVCDIGGGTSDFTLIYVRASEQGGDRAVQFHRVAVGDHLILGGDNLDLSLAHHIEGKLASVSNSPPNAQRERCEVAGELTPQQWDILVRSARRVKETLLGENPPERLTVHLPGTGAKLIGGGLQVDVERAEVEALLVDGFLPRCRLDERPSQRRSGFQEFGLPYAADPAITRYLAAFLTAHRHTATAGDDRDCQIAREAGHSGSDGSQAGRTAKEGSADDSARPDMVLFNGGFFASPQLRERLLSVLCSWFRSDEDPPRQQAERSAPIQWPQVLDNDRLDLAVAHGAAYYGMVQRGEGVRITANLARSYYIGVEQDEPAAVCLVPGDAEPGQEIELANTTFELTISEPVEFPLFVSSTRLADRPGDVVATDREQMTPLPPIRTVLQTSRKSERGTVRVHLHARLTEIGTIDLWCREIERPRSWRLQFDIRSTAQTDVTAHESAAESQGFVDEAQWEACQRSIARVFAADGEDDPAGLMKRLSNALECGRTEWPTSLLRRIWEALMELESGRRRSAAHGSRWLNLLGFALRPGYGFAVDDWRVAETWRAVHGRSTQYGSTQSLILWRRVAGGLSRGQQLAVAEPLLSAIRSLHRRFQGGRQRGGQAALDPTNSLEIWRLAGSLELLPVPVKTELGDIIVELLPKRKLQKVRDGLVWALGRIGQRIPVYGPLNTVVPSERAAAWLEALMHADGGESIDLLAAMQLARRTGDRHRDLSTTFCESSARWIADRGGPKHFVQLILDGGQLDHEEQSEVFGESLPKGLRIG